MDEQKYSDKDIEQINEFKNQFKKEKTPKIDDKLIDKKSSRTTMNPLQRIAPYFITTIIFFISILLLFLIFDKWLMPSLVHDREIVLVPDVMGKSEEEALKILSSAGLSGEVSGTQYSELHPENSIVNQIPKKMTEVKEGRPVFLTVSKGKEKVTAPYLLGKSIRDAKIELLSRGLKFGKVEYEHSNEFPQDTIMKQSIKSGKLIPYGSIIDFVVSLGSENQVAVPVLIGRRIEDVEHVLQEYNLKLGNVTYRSSETFMPNSIIETFPSQNSLVQEGTLINIVVSK
jgi:beta-lactam-binding protein with PASTA domain